MPTRRSRQPVVRKAKQARSKVTVAAIVEAAARVLAEQGWAGFNTNAVAARAGVSIGSLYEYFPDKQALVDEIASAHLTRAEALLASTVAEITGAEDPSTLVHALVRGLVDLHRDDPRLHRVLSSEAPLSAAIRARVETLRQEAIAFMGQAWNTHVDTPGVAAQLIVDTADAVIHRWFVEDDGQLTSAQRMTGELSRMLRAYLSSIPTPQARP
jgi:AcrR family transcriptional regulator